MRQNCTSLSTKKVHRSGPSQDAFGRKLQPSREILGPKALEMKATEAQERRKARLEGMFAVCAVGIGAEYGCNIHTEMTPDQRRALDALWDLPLAGNDDDEIDLGHVTIEDILDGSEPLNISHAGGELAALAKELKEGLQLSWVVQFSAFRMGYSQIFLSHNIPIRVNYQTRQDRNERRDRTFDEQLKACTEAYMNWNSGDPSHAEDMIPPDSGSTTVKVVGIYSSKFPWVWPGIF